ncbi:MAG: PhzF family phenazine biosynthesis protein [Sphingobium phenoxybenzoativorans]
MSQLPFVQVDAFASDPFTGNPAAVMPLEQWLPDDVMQAIAAENNLAETAFTIPAVGDVDADYELRWFTPAVEVKLCGHATLASAHVLMAGDSVRFRTRHAGVLDVSRREDGYALSLPAWAPAHKALPELAQAMGGDVVETLWRDGGYAVFLYRDQDAIEALTPDFSSLKEHGDILLIATAPGTGTDIVSRVFAPGAGIDEDPVTGSAHSIIVPYWAQRLGKPSITAFQASRRGGYIDCLLTDDRVVLTGQCRTVIEGMFSL